MASPMRYTEYNRLYRAMLRLEKKAISAHADVFRCVSPEYANQKDILSGKGAKLYGGRCNPVGIAAVYTSDLPEHAVTESLERPRKYGIPDRVAMPQRLECIAVDFSLILDLRDSGIRKQLGITKARLLDSNWDSKRNQGALPFSQIVGKAAYDLGIEGFFLPSRVTRGWNLIWFPENLKSTSLAKSISVT